MRTNVARTFKRVPTHEGASARGDNPSRELRRAVLSCLLWEDQFYVDGQEIAKRIVELASMLSPKEVADLAVEARSTYGLRHVPLLLLTVLAKTGAGIPKLVADTVATVIQRADEPGELLALYWKDGRKPLPAQFKKGLARAICKFDAYRLAKYDRDVAVKLRDVLFMVHAKPSTRSQEKVWKRLVEGTLESPDTWEVALSAGKDKKETFTRLLKEGNLGYLALLRNLRNMSEAGVDKNLVTYAILARENGANRVWPFRYIAAARAVPQFEGALDHALHDAIKELPELSGETIVLVDISHSMRAKLSERSDMTRMDSGAALASVIKAKSLRVFTFSEDILEVPPRRGMAGIDAIVKSQEHRNTYLGAAVRHLNSLEHDRLIVITDEQSHDPVPAPKAEHAYLINVASYKPSIASENNWTKIEGWSEGVLRYISEAESFD